MTTFSSADEFVERLENWTALNSMRHAANPAACEETRCAG